MNFNIADIFESAVDTYAQRDCLVCDDQRRSYAEMEARANQLAHHLQAQGIGEGDHIGIYAMNCVEWVESIWACFKLRAKFININYRYVAEELAYVFDNADLKAVIVQRQYLPLLAQLKATLPELQNKLKNKLQHILMIDDGTAPVDVNIDYANYEQAIVGQSTARDFAPRSEADQYIVYTGGTTGMPKGVVWRHREVMFALGGAVDQVTQQPVSDASEIIARGKEGSMTTMTIAPLMHGASQWAVISRAFEGGKVVLQSQFDAANTWHLIEREQINTVFIVGDAMARPMIEAYQAMATKPDTSSLIVLASSGALFSASIKDQFFECFPNLLIVDSIGASEVGGQGVALVQAGNTAMSGGGPTVNPLSGTVVLDEDTLQPIPAGSEKIGKVARRGYIPLEYYKDPVKTAQTFVVAADGERYSMPGDFARVEADGQITMLGRGSVSINSGGEKIFPEEVESAVKSHAGVFDCVVCGVPDAQWGSRVAAVIQLRDDFLKANKQPTLDDIQSHCRKKIAGYKVPREIHFVNAIPRSPAGKPDYQWAKSVALKEQ